MSNLYRGSSKDASYHVLIHLARQFQRRRFFQKSTNQKQEWPVVAMLINGWELNAHSLQMIFHGCFLPSFDSFDKEVSEKKIFQKSTNQKRELPVVAMLVDGLQLNQQSLQRTFQGCFLPNFNSFGQAVTIFASQGLRSALLIFTIGIVKMDFRGHTVTFICNATSGSCNQSEQALQKVHVLQEKCQQNKNAKNRQSGTILIV